MFFTGMIYRKETSNAKKAGWNEYKKKAGWLLPKFGNCWFISLLTYINIFALAFAVHLSGGFEEFLLTARYILATKFGTLHEIQTLIFG